MRFALIVLLIAGCDNKHTPTPVDGGQLRACYTEAACDGLRRGDRCYFAQPYNVDPSGFCARPEGECAVSRPFCGMDGKTIWACRFPAVPWKHQGACED